MKPPCIIVVNYLLPAIRILIAKELIEKHGLNRIEAAKRMGLTPAAITQYFKRVRGETALKIIEIPDEASKMISEMAEEIAEDRASAYDILKRICKICWMMRSKGLLCEAHREILPALREDEICEREFRFPLKYCLKNQLE